MVYQLCSPIDQISLEILPRLVSDGYHPPPIGSDDRHQGVDFSNYPFLTKYKSFLGVTVQSVLPGYVRASVAGSFPFGNVVIVETPDDVLPGELAASLGIPEGQSLYLLYAHMNEPPSVKLGQEVTACQAVGSVGASGNTYAPHLHLETRYGPPGVDFDGFSAFVDGVTEKERANYKLWRTSGMFQHFNPLRLLAPDAIPTPTALPD
jgi:murein DD-endopeptidase MepM/ murein hydrolase activator NlpD